MTKRFLAFLLLLSALTVQAGTYGPDVRVQVIVEAQTKHGKFRDAIYLSKAQFDAKSDAEIQALKDARVAAFVAAVDAAKTATPEVLTKAELQAEYDRLIAEADEVQTKIATAPLSKPLPTPLGAK